MKTPEEIAEEIVSNWRPSNVQSACTESLIEEFAVAIRAEREHSKPTTGSVSEEELKCTHGNDDPYSCQQCFNANGELFEHNGLRYYVGWMKSKDGEDDYWMWVNEQPNGGFKWTFLDFEPKDKENYKKIYVTPLDPRAATRAEWPSEDEIAKAAEKYVADELKPWINDYADSASFKAGVAWLKSRANPMI